MPRARRPTWSRRPTSARNADPRAPERRGPTTRSWARRATSSGTSGLRWVVDPLDGTANFLFGIPQWCVSIACEDAGASPASSTTRCAARPGAATRDGPATLDGVGSAPARRPSWRRARRDGLRSTPACASPGRVGRAAAAPGPRRPAARRAALDLAWTAAGRFDAYYERGVKHWDVAAGRCSARAPAWPCASWSRRRRPRAASWWRHRSSSTSCWRSSRIDRRSARVGPAHAHRRRRRLLRPVAGARLPPAAPLPASRAGRPKLVGAPTKATSKAPGKLGHWLSKPFRSSQKAISKSGSSGRKGRSKMPF